MIRINYIIKKLTFDILQTNNRFPDVHQEELVSKHDRNLVQSTRNVKTQHVSQDNIEA